jgi:hypothetical protein
MSEIEPLPRVDGQAVLSRPRDAELVRKELDQLRKRVSPEQYARESARLIVELRKSRRPRYTLT